MMCTLIKVKKSEITLRERILGSIDKIFIHKTLLNHKINEVFPLRYQMARSKISSFSLEYLCGFVLISNILFAVKF